MCIKPVCTILQMVIESPMYVSATLVRKDKCCHKVSHVYDTTVLSWGNSAPRGRVALWGAVSGRCCGCLVAEAKAAAD